jgi:hypothetical protein
MDLIRNNINRQPLYQDYMYLIMYNLYLYHHHPTACCHAAASPHYPSIRYRSASRMHLFGRSYLIKTMLMT